MCRSTSEAALASSSPSLSCPPASFELNSKRKAEGPQGEAGPQSVLGGCPAWQEREAEGTWVRLGGAKSHPPELPGHLCDPRRQLLECQGLQGARGRFLCGRHFY